MKYLILEPKVKAIAPNIALMKLARWCEQDGHEYQYVRGQVDPKITPDVILMSCIFSYYSKVYEKTIDFYLNKFPDAKITVGGVFPTLNPQWFNKWNGRINIHNGLCHKIDNLTPKFNVDIQSEDRIPYQRNNIVLYASRGCPNKCGYCAVPRLEGDMRSFRSIQGMLDTAKKEMPNATGVVLYDNNFTEHRYFKKIVKELAEYGLPVDILNSHVDSFTRDKAKLLSKLNWQSQAGNGLKYIRFSFDKFEYAENIRNALRYIVQEDIKATVFCYVLYNWMDSPEDVWKKIQICQDIVDDVGEPIQLFFQRFEPYNSLVKNTHVGKRWSKELLTGFAKLYENSRGHISVTHRNRKLYEWIGNTQEEFLERIYKLGTEKDFQLQRIDIMKEIAKKSEMKFHPVAGIFPLMNAEEFEALKSDIEKHGQLESIWTYEGKIIDGRNRYLACQQLGIKPKVKKWVSKNGNELIDFVISLNLNRRHLNASQKALVAVDALPHFEKLAKKRLKLSKGRGKKGVAKMPQDFYGKSRDITAKVFGVGGRYISYAKQIQAKDPNLAQEIRDGKKTITKALNQIKLSENIPNGKDHGNKYQSKKKIQIMHADFYQWCNENLKDNSIDLVFTEPPNNKKSLPLYKKLAEESARVLKPSGFLVAYCGHRYLDKVIHILSKHLNYHWLYCIDLNGNGNNHRQNNIFDQWQPVLVYFKPPFKQDRISKDFLKDSGNGTHFHNNQQTENGFSYFMEMFSAPGDIVLDPMMGNGGVLKVAKRLDRKSIGIDIDSDCVEIAKGQLL